MSIPDLVGKAQTVLGPGYAHILNNVVPLMRQKGMTQEQIQTLMVVNPGRLLTFV